MKKSDIKELQYITHIANLSSILEKGILSHKLVEQIPHEHIDNKEVQKIREQKYTTREQDYIPGGIPLHNYVNLYLCARNPMLYCRKELHENLCILRITPSILNIDGAIITDRNAACGISRFLCISEEMPDLNKDLIFARFWKLGNDIEYNNRKQIKCAEVLVPNQLNPSYIFGIFVSCKSTKLKVIQVFPETKVSVNPDIFFL